MDNIQHVLSINKPETDVGQINPSITVREYTHKGFLSRQYTPSHLSTGYILARCTREHTYIHIGNIIHNIHIHKLHTFTCMYIVHMYMSTLIHRMHTPSSTCNSIAVIWDNIDILVYLTFELFRFTQHTMLRCWHDVSKVLKSNDMGHLDSFSSIPETVLHAG